MRCSACCCSCACLFTRLPLPVKAGAIIVTSAFYVVSFYATRGAARLVVGRSVAGAFQAPAGARIVEPHSLAGDPGAIHLWVEELDDDNRPSGVPRAYRLPYDVHLAEKTEAAIKASAERQAAGRRPHGGFRHRRRRRESDHGARDHAELDHHDRGGDPWTGGPLDPGVAPDQSGSIVFSPLPPPRMPPKDTPP